MATDYYGAGLFPAGVFGAGYGQPASVDAPPPLAAAAEARAIDPIAKDYDRDELGRIEGMTGTAQRVMLAMTTLRGSAIDPLLGLSPVPDRITDTIAQTLEDDVRRALSSLVREGAITIVSIDTVTNGTRLSRRVRWIDVSDPDEVQVTTDG